MFLKFAQVLIFMASALASIHCHWAQETTNGHGKLAALDVICGKDHMTVRAEFAGPFHGSISSKGTYGQDNCVYIKPYSGVTHATFKVYYDQCGTKPDLQGKYYENTVVIQYGPDIIEAYDEAKRLRCEWFEAYEKPATFRPAIPVADLDVVEMNFQGDDIDCWMEIQEGKGPWGREVSRIVPVGQPMTIVIAINDYNGQFDMRVKSCFAHDGVKPPIHMTDEYGCVLRPKMLTKFNKIRDPNGKATVISYSHFYAFKFPDSMNVQIQCTVEVCRHGCPDACQKTPYVPDHQIKQQTSISYGKDHKPPVHHRHSEDKRERFPIREDENSGPVSQDLQNSGSANVPGHSEAPVNPLPNPIKTAENSAHQNFESSRIPSPVYRGASNSSEEIDNRRESIREPEEVNYEADDKIEEESKLHEKVLNMKISDDAVKPVISEQDLANLPSGTLDKAAQLFKDLGMSVDMANLATGFVDGINSKNLAQILDNDRIRELAESSGVKLAADRLPQVQPLVGGPQNGDDDDNVNANDGAAGYADDGGDAEEAENRRKKHNDGLGDRILGDVTTSSVEHWTSSSPTPSNNPVSTVPSQASLPSSFTSEEKGQLGSSNASEPVADKRHPHQQTRLQRPHPSLPVNPPQHRHPSISPSHLPDQSDHHRHYLHNNRQRNNNIGNNPHRNHGHPQPVKQIPISSENRPSIHSPNIMPHQQSVPVIPEIINIPLGFGISPNFNKMLASTVTQQHLIHRNHPIRDQHNLPNLGLHRQPNHPVYKPQSILASLGNHLPHFNLPSFLNSASVGRQDNNLGKLSPPFPQRPTISGQFPQGPRGLRKRRSPSDDPFVSVKRGFQVVTSIDLQFMPNTTDLPEIYSGRREDIVYGVCMPFNGLIAGLTTIVGLIVFSLTSSFFFMRKLKTLRKKSIGLGS